MIGYLGFLNNLKIIHHLSDTYSFDRAADTWGYSRSLVIDPLILKRLQLKMGIRKIDITVLLPLKELRVLASVPTIAVFQNCLNEIQPEKHSIIEKNIDLNSLKELILNDEKVGLTTAEIYKIKIFLKVGEIEKAKELLNKAYLSALNPEDYVSKTVYPDGTEEIKTSKSKINTEYVERLKKIGEENNITLK